MTERATLEQEREALTRALASVTDEDIHSALSSSIARIDALLGLSDQQCADLASDIEESVAWYQAHGKRGKRGAAAALRTVADLVRRTS